MRIGPPNDVPPPATTPEARAAESARGRTGNRAKDEERLRQVSQQFESIFIGQLFQVMRQSAQHESLGGEVESGEDMFSGIFDDAMAQEAARRMQRGLGEAMYRQLAARLDGPASTGSGETTP
jgi:Rod binding domain-containing protein